MSITMSITIRSRPCGSMASHLLLSLFQSVWRCYVYSCIREILSGWEWPSSWTAVNYCLSWIWTESLLKLTGDGSSKCGRSWAGNTGPHVLLMVSPYKAVCSDVCCQNTECRHTDGNIAPILVLQWLCHTITPIYRCQSLFKEAEWHLAPSGKKHKMTWFMHVIKWG